MKQKKIIIRADGNARIGAGHLMRCLTIADAIPDKESVAFVCADEDSAALARDRGYAAYVLHTDYADMEAELPVWEHIFAEKAALSRADEVKKHSVEEPDAEKVSAKKHNAEELNAEKFSVKKHSAEALCTEKLNAEKLAAEARVILVDSYHITNTYLAGLRRFGKVVVLDDMAKTPWDADAVINYNAFANQEMYEALKSPYAVKYYIGGKYIPIRREFCGGCKNSDNSNESSDGCSKCGDSDSKSRDSRSKSNAIDENGNDRKYEVRDEVKNILITTGGGDCDNIAGQILEKIWSAGCHFHVVTGRFNPHYDTLLKLTEVHSNIHIYHDVKNMAELMARCDLAVTAGGTTIYELSAIGVPFVCFSYAENQEKLTEYIGRNRIAGYGGAFHKAAEETLEAIREQITELMEDAKLRREYAEAERKLVDGRGAARIAEIICSC